MGVYFMADGDGSKFIEILGLGCLIAWLTGALHMAFARAPGWDFAL